jgi:hypothetical protein
MNGARKLSVLLVVAAAVLTTGGMAWGQVYHQYPGAPVVDDTSPDVGALIGFGEDTVRLVGYGRFNASDVSDIGIEVVLDRFDPPFVGDGWRFGAAADFRYAIVTEGSDLPFDLSLDGGLGFQTGADVTNVNIPVGAVISRPLELKEGRIMVPYGGLFVVFTNWSYDLPPGFPDPSDSEIDLVLRLGASIYITDGISVFANGHVGNGEMFALGLNSSL